MISPALTGTSIEIFEGADGLRIITDGRIYDWDDMPIRVRRALEEDMKTEPGVAALLVDMDREDRLRTYVRCRYGRQSPAPDFCEKGIATPEPCGCTSCPLDSLFRKGLRARYGRLTERELQVLRALAAGSMGKEVAHQLGLSPNTIDNHRASIFRKTGTTTNVELARWAFIHGVIDTL